MIDTLKTGAGHMAVYWDIIPSPLGLLYGAVNAEGALVRLKWVEDAGSDTEAPGRDPRRLAAVKRQVEEYFDGSRRQLDLAVDLSPLTPFQQRVLAAVSAIPYGTMQTYKTVATRVGSPRGARAVGGALGKNPVTLVVPCHRVVAQGDGMGGFSAVGGIAVKEWLLRFEGALRG